MQPKVSVVIAARNEEIHVREAIASILGQSDITLELVFVDDNSTDRTHEIVAEIAKGDNRLTLLRNPKSGKVSAFNLGVAQTRGEWVCIFSGDDIMPPGSLAARVAVVDAVQGDRPIAGLSRMITMCEDKKRDGMIVPRNPEKGSFSGSSYMMNRRAIDVMWPAPEDLPNEDTWLEMCALYLGVALVHSGVIGCAWRIHAGNSINLEVAYPEFNAKITPRMAAHGLFLRTHGHEVADDARRELEARVRLEEARKTGDLLGMLRSGAGLIATARAVSLSNATFYALRSRAYTLLSGW